MPARRHLWIAISLVLPIAFTVIALMRPPQVPGVVIETHTSVSTSAPGAQPAGVELAPNVGALAGPGGAPVDAGVVGTPRPADTAVDTVADEMGSPGSGRSP